MERTYPRRRDPVPHGGERIDIGGAWWQGFYQGWHDGQDVRPRALRGTAPTPPTAWWDGYEAGWVASRSNCDRGSASARRARC